MTDAIWLRRQKGGTRAVTPIPVRVVGRTPAGAVVIERTRRGRVIRDRVHPKNLRPVEVASTEGSQ